MPTIIEVKKSIDDIKDNGNNSAQTVRKVLNDILAYATPTSNTSNIDTFSFEGNASDNISNIHYSIRGIKNHFANITLNLEVIESSSFEVDRTFYYEIKERELFEEMSKIVVGKNQMVGPNYLMTFVNKNEKTEQTINKRSGNFFRLASFRIEFDSLKSVMLLTIRKYSNSTELFISGDNAMVSFTIHVPK